MEVANSGIADQKMQGDPLIIVGSGNVAFNLYKFASILGYSITMIDNDPQALTRERFPEAKEIKVGDIVPHLQECAISSQTSIVLLSHHHQYDEAALVAVIDSPARYIGIMGNKRKVTAYFSALEEKSTQHHMMERVHIPIGLDLGGELAAEIALAAMAEIQAVKYGRPGGFVTIKHSSGGDFSQYDQLF